MFSNKNILITGGAGFIGSNLCDYFISQNNHITCLDNFATGKRKNITQFTHNIHKENTHRRTILKAPSSSEDACAGLPMRARRLASVWNRMGLSFCLLF